MNISEIEIERTLEDRIAEAASDYKLALSDEEFSLEFGGVEKLRSTLFSLVTEWEVVADAAILADDESASPG